MLPSVVEGDDKVPAKPEQNRTIWSVFASGFRAKQSRNLTVTV
jgi:hypothetical protein